MGVVQRVDVPAGAVIAAFQRDGYLPRLAVMPPAEAERYRALIARCYSLPVEA